jgi:two-component system, NarL family, sensor kinase
VYRTAQEALQNVAKHANARNVRVRLYLQRDKMVLEVADDGTGFDPAAVSAGGAIAAGGEAMGAGAPTGFGLAGMRERAELLGGKLELSSSPKRGTTVRLTVPLNPPPTGPGGPLSLSPAGPGGPLPPPGRPVPGLPGPRPGRPG